MLIENSANYNININEKGPHEMTALHYACKMGRLKMVQMFLQNSDEINIDLNARDAIGMTAFHYACINDARSKNGSTQIFELILFESASLKIDVNAKNANGLTPLDFVKYLEAQEMVEILEQRLSKKPKVETSTDQETLRNLCEKDLETIFGKRKKMKCCV